MFEVETPKIIIPECSTNPNSGYGLFDAGRLSVRGFISFEGKINCCLGEQSIYNF